ncbi:MAG: pseudouridine synthase, partial [Bacillota bacterium]
VTEPGTRVDPESDTIEVDGRVISEEKKVYILLNKPEGYVTTVDDPHGRRTVLDLIEGVPQRIYPVGRLDFDTSGLLLLTNDGELTHILTHPSYMIDKTYLVRIEGEPDRQQLQYLEEGVDIGDIITSPADVEVVRRQAGDTLFYITIHEGRNRQVRRMCEAIGYQVKGLTRVAFGPLDLQGLSRGEFRFLREDELIELKQLKNRV